MGRKFFVFIVSCLILFGGVLSSFAEEKKVTAPVTEEKKVAPATEEKRITPAPVEEKKPAPVVEEKKTAPAPAPVVEEKKLVPAPAPAVEEKKPAPAAPVVEEKKPTPAPAPVVEEKKPVPVSVPVVEEKKPTPAPAPVVEEKKLTIEEKRITVTVESVEGTARLQVTKTNQWDALKIGMILSPGETITTFARAKVVLKFEDESTVEIGENSIFTIKGLKKTIVVETKEEKKETNLILQLGKVNTKTKKLGPKDKFEIYTPAAVCSVRGTNFSVEVDEKKATKVKCLEGNVGVKEISGIGEEVLVKENQQTVVQAGTAPSIPEVIPPEKTELPKEEKPTKGAKEEKPKEEKPAEAGKGKAFGMGGNVGAVTLTGSDGKQKVYSQISLQPEFSLGKFGVGLDLYFYFDENNNIRKEDWDSANDILTKIMYVRYGQKRDPVFVYLGVFPSMTLGHGLIMNRYSNMLKYPDERKIGFELDLDFGLIGFESLLTDLQNPEIFAGRAYIRPFYKSGVPLLKKLAVGGSGVHDVDASAPDTKSDTKDNGINILGVDVDLPLSEKALFTSIAYADVARMEIGKIYKDAGHKSGGMGYAFGFMGNIIKFVNYRLEYRGSQRNFISQYFGSYYENERGDNVGGKNLNKAWTIAKATDPDIDKTKQGPYLEIGFNLLGKVNFITTYENMDEPYLYSEFSVDPALLMNKYSFSASYTKKGSADPMMTTKLGYSVSSGVFVILTRKKTFDRNGKTIETTYIETKMKL